MLNSFLAGDLRCELRTERNSRIYDFLEAVFFCSNAFMLDFFCIRIIYVDICFLSCKKVFLLAPGKGSFI